LVFGNIYIETKKNKMAEKQNLVEEALIQMKSLENIVAENAKGILASTMKEEISELVKESLQTEDDSELGVNDGMMEDLEEQDEDDLNTDDDDSNEDDNLSMGDDMSMEDDDDSDEDDDFDFSSMNDDDDDEPIDLTSPNISDEDLFKVFKNMKDSDSVIIKKDGNTVDIEDTEANVEYKIQMGEGEEDESWSMDEEMSEEMDEEMDEELDESMFEMNMNDDDDDFEEIDLGNDFGKKDEVDFSFDDEDDDNSSEIMFEIEMDEDSMEMDESEEDEFMEMDESEEMDEDWNESADMKKSETKEGFKPKGVGMGKAKFSYSKGKGGFKEDMKHGNPTQGTGKPKFEFKEGEKPMMKKPMKAMAVKGGETTEAARTLGNGSNFRKGGLPKPKAHSSANTAIKESTLMKEVELLRERNEEYRKALNVFRSKLNEVAVFNSNLAYATRLFTEHSTTKNEKINILRRFDSVESLKESKSLYKTIKDELGSEGNKTVVKESIANKIERTPASGSAVNLMESKTYENPQFLRMKDLMTKMSINK
jgi:hypothetical protein